VFPYTELEKVLQKLIRNGISIFFAKMANSKHFLVFAFYQALSSISETNQEPDFSKFYKSTGAFSSVYWAVQGKIRKLNIRLDLYY